MEHDVPGQLDPATYLYERYAGGGRRGPALELYYTIKPVLPRSTQLALRRVVARRQARRAFPAWPIEPLLVDDMHERWRAGLRASGGDRMPIVGLWPGGRRFAAILTHDVEGPEGVANIPRVLEVEARHGMVSSWNFCGDWYPIPDGTFDLVRDAGGEVGLHGIKHDGKLFSSRESFEANLPLIHQTLAEWEAVGFRSPATHRNPDWMPELGCLYDSSFPDTDPFEPQSGGCCSVLPYFIGDLVELPITLVQDHTLWEILRDDSIDRWVEKTDWIVEQRGLVNIIVHPDYVVDPDRLAIYEKFLAFLRQRLDARDGWHALPREVAAWWRAREGMVIENGEIAGAAPAGLEPRIAWVSEAADGSIAIDAG